jgi:hypothetical protein
MYAMGPLFAKAFEPAGFVQGPGRQKVGLGHDRYNPQDRFVSSSQQGVESMYRSRLAEATLIGCLTALASFCALNARAGETYSVVAQSDRSSAGTGRRPLAERIAAANLPIIAPTAAVPAATVPTATAPRRPAQREATARAQETATPENMAVAAVRVDQQDDVAPTPPPRLAITPPVLWPFGPKRPAATTARSSGNGTSSSKPASVTR